MKSTALPWAKEYRLLGIPSSLKPYGNKPVWNILEETAKKFKKMGLIQYNYKMAYPELLDKASRLATALYGMGLNKGDRVVTILPTSIQYVLADYAISRAGLVHVPCSELEPADTLEHKFSESKPLAIICLAKHVKIIRPLLKSSSIKYIVLTRLEDFGSNLLSPESDEEDYDFSGVSWMTSLIENTPPNPPDIDFKISEDIETLLFTGGTTGLPKGCMLTHANIIANSKQVMHCLGQLGLATRGGISVLVGLPFFHSYGHIIMHALTLFGFDQVLITDPRDTDAMVRMIREHHPVVQFGVPTQFMELSKKELKGTGMIGISGSASLPPNTQAEYEKKSGGGIMEGYGLSEMSPISHLNTSLLVRLMGGRIPLMLVNNFIRILPVKFVANRFIRLMGPRASGWLLTRFFGLLFKLTGSSKLSAKTPREKRGAIGIPYPDTEIKILDIGTSNELTWEEVMAGKIGEMVMRGPQRMLGYWPDPGDGFDDEGYIHTSDVVKLDEKGYFYIVDRTKDMIIVSGYKVYSRELDDILSAHEKVEMAAVVGVPDLLREGSERVVVYIQPREKYRNKITEDEIIDYLKEKVARYAVTRHVFFLDEMPVTEVQKVNKKLLREMAVARIKLEN